MSNRVKSLHQSPMNPLRWCLTLDCGHEEWITSKRKPLRVANPCSKCKEIARAEPRKEKP